MPNSAFGSVEQAAGGKHDRVPAPLGVVQGDPFSSLERASANARRRSAGWISHQCSPTGPAASRDP